LGERELCKLEVVGSIPIGSTIFGLRQKWLRLSGSLLPAPPAGPIGSTIFCLRQEWFRLSRSLNFAFAGFAGRPDRRVARLRKTEAKKTRSWK
jgi:hypothetical protein